MKPKLKSNFSMNHQSQVFYFPAIFSHINSENHALISAASHYCIKKDCSGDYYVGRNQCGEQLLDRLAISRFFVPSHSDAHKLFPFLQKDDLASIFSARFFRSLEFFLSFLSKRGGLTQIAALSSIFCCKLICLFASKCRLPFSISGLHKHNNLYTSSKIVGQLVEISFFFFRKTFRRPCRKEFYHNYESLCFGRLVRI